LESTFFFHQQNIITISVDGKQTLDCVRKMGVEGVKMSYEEAYEILKPFWVNIVCFSPT